MGQRAQGQRNNGGVPILGRDMTVRLAKGHVEILRIYGTQKNVGLHEAASQILRTELERMAQCYAVEIACIASGMQRML